MHKQNYELTVLVNNKPIREYYHKDRFYIEAKNGTEYSLKLKNHNHKRIMAIVSVDGIEVLKGGNAADAESGYIVNPYSTLNLQGYRIDDNNVATFKFSDGKQSYATKVEQKFDKEKIEKVKKGQIAPAKNNGVIGVRIYEEKDSTLIPAWDNGGNSINKNYFYGNGGFVGGSTLISGCSFNGNLTYSGCLSQVMGSGHGLQSAMNIVNNMGIFSYNPICTTGFIPSSYYNSLGNSSAQINTFTNNTSFQSTISNYTPNFSLGTTWGQKVEDKVVKVTFVKSDEYIDLEIFYLERAELIKLGVDLDNTKKVFVSGYPKAFADKEDYCKKPADWKE